MEKTFFQTEEIELKCVAFFQKTIADFQEQVIIKTFNSEFLLSKNVALMNVSHFNVITILLQIIIRSLLYQWKYSIDW